MPQVSRASLVEAHTYAGGLRYTLFGEPSRRPAWLPAADAVGWRDEFELRPDDTVVEFSQRAKDGDKVTWIAVYKRSVDARLGDRSNHAGIGVWLSSLRIADARALLVSLHEFATALAANPEPDLVADNVAEFASDRFLGSYLVAAEALPPDWSGAPPTGSALADTTMNVVIADSFAAALDSVAEAVTRLSLSWTNSAMTPRTLIRVSNNPADLDQPGFAPLQPGGAFLADVLERIPEAFKASGDALRAAEEDAARSRDQFELEIRGLKADFDEERRQSAMLDGAPATLESVARQLNQLSRQTEQIIGRLSAAPGPVRPEAVRLYNKPKPLPTRNTYSPEPEEIGTALLLVYWLAPVLIIIILIAVFAYDVI